MAGNNDFSKLVEHLEKDQDSLAGLRLATQNRRSGLDKIELNIHSYRSTFAPVIKLYNHRDPEKSQLIKRLVHDLTEIIAQLNLVYSRSEDADLLTDVERMRDADSLAFKEVKAIYLIDCLIQLVQLSKTSTQFQQQNVPSYDSAIEQLKVARNDIQDYIQGSSFSASKIQSCYENILNAKRHFRRCEVLLGNIHWSHIILSDPDYKKPDSTYFLLFIASKLLEYVERKGLWNLTHIEEKRCDERAIAWQVSLSTGLNQLIDGLGRPISVDAKSDSIRSVLQLGSTNLNLNLARSDIYILHISDIHLENEDQAVTYASQLIADLTVEQNIPNLDYMVVSGNITSKAEIEEYQAAKIMLTLLKESLNLPDGRLIITPGNQDIEINASKKAYVPNRDIVYDPSNPRHVEDGKTVCVRDDDLYEKRLANFNVHLFSQLCSGEYPLALNEQSTVVKNDDDRIIFLGLSSCWHYDSYHENEISINEIAISALLDEYQTENYKDWLKIAVWHHSISEINNKGVLERLAISGFKICLHGHVQQNTNESLYKRYFYDYRYLHIIGAGPFGPPTKGQNSRAPSQYNLLVFGAEKDEIAVHTRKKEKPEGAWSADARWGDKNDPKAWYRLELSSKL